MAFKNGLEFVIYYKAQPFADATEVTNAAIASGTFDVARFTQTSDNNRGNETEDFTIRGDAASGGLTIASGSSRTGEISITTAYNTDDAFYDLCEQASIDGTEIAIVDTDGLLATSGTKGVAGNYTVPTFNRSSPAGVSTVAITLRAGEIRNEQYRAP